MHLYEVFTNPLLMFCCYNGLTKQKLVETNDEWRNSSEFWTKRNCRYFLGKLNEHDKLAKVTEEIEKMKEAQVHFLTICEVLFLSS